MESGPFKGTHMNLLRKSTRGGDLGVGSGRNSLESSRQQLRVRGKNHLGRLVLLGVGVLGGVTKFFFNSREVRQSLPTPT